jgi:hypothetical protein
MKTIVQHIKKQRNDTDTQVKKYKQDLDVIGIRYDHKSAHVEVPNHATGGFEYFKWDWMTSTTGSHSEIVQIFKKIVRTLKETKNNPAQYENLVSNLDASTKNALDVNIKKHNITVPTQDTNKLIDEVLTGMQTWLDTKSHIPIELKQKFLELGSNNLEKFIESAFNKFNNQWTVKEFIDNAFVPPREESNKYLADSGCDSTEQLWTKMENLRISEALNKATTSSVSSSNFKGNTSDEDSDDDIEVISKILGSEVTLTNGAKYEVKKIIDLLDKPNFIQQLTNILSKLSPEDYNLVKKEIALKLAYISNNDMDKYEAVHEIVDNMPQTFIDEFNNYDTLTLDQMRIEEAKILGDGVSYL